MFDFKMLVQRIGWPGLVTLLSLFSSTLAVYFLITTNPKSAIFFAALAFQLDVLDGYLARALGKSSEFGRQLDSLSDLINYSLVAALTTMIYLIPNLLGVFIGFLILGFGAIRLALFNQSGFIEKEGSLSYRGLITCTLSFSTLILFFIDRVEVVKTYEFREFIYAAVLALLALGQVSSIRMPKKGVFLVWIPLSIIIGIGSLLWL
ncbi:MAG: CDP-alcohol phosphatidyltransferase family protein [Rhodoluna sp.]